VPAELFRTRYAPFANPADCKDVWACPRSMGTRSHASTARRSDATSLLTASGMLYLQRTHSQDRRIQSISV
jgi:hypothetical protein